MKNNKLFKSLSALALAGIMAFSSVSLVSADETQVTDKSSFDMVFENEVGVKYLSEEDTIRVYEEIFGRKVDEAGNLTLSKYADVHIIDEDTIFSVDWDNSTYSEEDVTGVYLLPFLWYKDENSTLNVTKMLIGNDVELENGEGVLCPATEKLSLCENIDNELNIRDNFYYPLSDYNTHSNYEKMMEAYGNYDMESLETIPGSDLIMRIEQWGIGILSDIYHLFESSDETTWKETIEVLNFTYGSTPYFEKYFNERMFLACVCIDYNDPETGNPMTAWTYIASEGALTSEYNPFTYLDEKPADDTTVEDDKNDDTTTDVKEVTLTEDNKAISKDDMAALITENATKDVVIKTPAGITLTFAKGTMKAVDGKDTYDFGVSMSDDYSKHSNMGVVTKDNFVSLIDFNYSGNLPAEATVKIPVGADRAGQTLYYSQKVEAGYTLVQSVKVDDEGYITVKQDHCSTYVVTTTDVSKDNSADVPAGPDETPDTGDTNNVIMYVVLFVVAGAMLAVLTSSKMRKRA